MSNHPHIHSNTPMNVPPPPSAGFPYAPFASESAYRLPSQSNEPYPFLENFNESHNSVDRLIKAEECKSELKVPPVPKYPQATTTEQQPIATPAIANAEYQRRVHGNI
eukprot:TRINITY_DN314_c0_g1_i2.p4 TRINITY_DN314_c0_g1~~TRINITY_DN314_c0_g1_i2.p4  ORF type:complete len:108 (-),score=6.38 TRINITY_DN314_c0_g1_i2:305-628(-)